MSFTLRTQLLLKLFFLCLFAILLCSRQLHTDRFIVTSVSEHRGGSQLQRTQPTLVVYVLSFEDAAYIENFKFFVIEAVYFLIIGNAVTVYIMLAPGKDRLLGRKLFFSRRADNELVERFVLVSSAVKGPFIPPAMRDVVTWHVALGQGLGTAAGLAGGVVSCAQPSERRELGESELPLNPFLDFTALAATRAAIIELLRLPNEQFECPAAEAKLSREPAVAVYSAALLAMDGLTAAEAEAMKGLRAWSAAVLGAGMGLSSLVVRQQGVDWSDKQMWRCNGGLSPLLERANDGLSLLPFEAMFLPVSEYDDVDMPYGAAGEFARAYSEWMLAASIIGVAPSKGMVEQEVGRKVGQAVLGTESASLHTFPSHMDLAARNSYYQLGSEYKLPGVLVAVAQGEDCFDARYFLQANPDVVGLSNHEAWKFFVFYAQFQPRPYRLKCGVDWSKYGLKGSGPAMTGSYNRRLDFRLLLSVVKIFPSWFRKLVRDVKVISPN
ncbi:hypothetical protein VOLCADRAFT_87385 [Volvox carteri f. nagariensis]|uniref:Uncharacterized protein n=1 Tax=Volvox carteri f. nagariensis TaxID=3068 RepID=D8TL77_VOLCA|nr:uncharacterized protein VOLCADRAFT_87385 [Volvox carteri f. nagariensis]EFJ51822.1 hypothetical protein VOLCADRAFT_87385 [Volvox carteri f. nagariensis]|eukprot:XP_002947232.1 hypothetical protein VOLCADRAFT_87385 [Volvox carteri f. nagariensis]